MLLCAGIPVFSCRFDKSALEYSTVLSAIYVDRNAFVGYDAFEKMPKQFETDEYFPLFLFNYRYCEFFFRLRFLFQ